MRHGARVIRYGELHVWDDTGRELAAELVLADHTLAIQIDDEDAAYPILVDPLMTSPAWTAESNQASASFGVSVATAGDVNGDGYSDVIVGASDFDNPTIGEGRAFVYHGSASGLSVTPLDRRRQSARRPSRLLGGDGGGCERRRVRRRDRRRLLLQQRRDGRGEGLRLSRLGERAQPQRRAGARRATRRARRSGSRSRPRAT